MSLHRSSCLLCSVLRPHWRTRKRPSPLLYLDERQPDFDYDADNVACARMVVESTAKERVGYGQRVATGWGLLLRGRNGPCGSCCASAVTSKVRRDDSFGSKSGTWYINGVGGVCGRNVAAQGCARGDILLRSMKSQKLGPPKTASLLMATTTVTGYMSTKPSEGVP